MGKKDRKGGKGANLEAKPLPSAQLDPITSFGKKVITIGLATAGLGYIVLTRADAMGRNWESVASPFLILSGYALIGLGIFLPEPEKPKDLPPPPAS